MGKFKKHVSYTVSRQQRVDGLRAAFACKRLCVLMKSGKPHTSQLFERQAFHIYICFITCDINTLRCHSPDSLLFQTRILMHRLMFAHYLRSVLEFRDVLLSSVSLLLLLQMHTFPCRVKGSSRYSNATLVFFFYSVFFHEFCRILACFLPHERMTVRKFNTVASLISCQTARELRFFPFNP